MSFFTSLGILLLAMVILFFLQLGPGTFAIFYHSALANFSRKRADDLSLSFILGQEAFTALAFLATFMIASFSFQEPNFFVTDILPCIIAGLFVALAVFIAIFYFRPGASDMRLFVPRRFVASLMQNTKKARNRSDCIMLGFITAGLESFFTIPLYLAVSLVIINFPILTSNLIIIIGVLIAALPLFIIRCFYVLGNNLAEIERLRIRYRNLIRLILVVSYLSIAALIILNKAQS